VLHLIHPALVHFSVALLIVGGLLESWGLLRVDDAAARGGGRLVVAGTLFLFPTIVTGYIAANTVDFTDPALVVLDAHERNGVILLMLFCGLLFWKGWLRGRPAGRQRVIYAVALLVGVALTIYSALLGGELVYVHGTGVIGT